MGSPMKAPRDSIPLPSGFQFGGALPSPPIHRFPNGYAFEAGFKTSERFRGEFAAAAGAVKLVWTGGTRAGGLQRILVGGEGADMGRKNITKTPTLFGDNPTPF